MIIPERALRRKSHSPPAPPSLGWENERGRWQIIPSVARRRSSPPGYPGIRSQLITPTDLSQHPPGFNHTLRFGPAKNQQKAHKTRRPPACAGSRKYCAYLMQQINFCLSGLATFTGILISRKFFKQCPEKRHFDQNIFLPSQPSINQNDSYEA